MKIEIKHEGIWWKYLQICDRCGEKYYFEQTNEPNVHEADFCLNCLRYLLDNNIPYKDAEKQYKTEALWVK